MKTLMLLLSLISLGLTGCGRKNGDPLKDYDFASKDIPVSKVVIKKQSYALCGSTIEYDKLIIVEGESKQQKLKIKGPDAKRVSSFVLEDSVAGLSLAKSVAARKTKDDDIKTENVNEAEYEQDYNLVFKSKRGLVAYGEGAKIIETSLIPQNQKLAAISCALPVQIEVQKIKGIPAIQSVDAQKSLKFEEIADLNLVVNVKADQISKIEDLKLNLGFDQSRQSKENPMINLTQLKPEASLAIPTPTGHYQFKIKVSGEAIKAAVEKASSQNKKKSFFDLHFTISVTNELNKEASLTHDYVLRIDKPVVTAISAVTTTPPTAGVKK